MRVKKHLALLLAAVMAAGVLSGCNWWLDDDEDSSSSGSSSSSSQSTGGEDDKPDSEPEPVTYVVTAIIGEGGTMTIDGTTVNDGDSASFPEGAEITFIVTPNDGYRIDSVTAGGETLTGTNGSYTYTVNESCIIEVVFAEDLGYTVDSNGTYNVYSTEGFLAWAQAAQTKPDTNCTLTSKIDISGVTWNSFDYSGILNGNGYTLSGLSAPLFGQLQSGGRVENLTVNAGTISANSKAGSIAGENAGTIAYCIVNISGTFSSNGNNGDDFVGGVAGQNDGTIRYCMVTVENGAALNSGNSNAGVGGIAAVNDNGEIENCAVIIEGALNNTATFARRVAGGVVGNGNASSCAVRIEATGSISGITIGAIAGASNSITNCYWDNQNIELVIGGIGDGSGSATQNATLTTEIINAIQSAINAASSGNVLA